MTKTKRNEAGEEVRRRVIHNYSLAPEPIEQQVRARRHHPAQVLTTEFDGRVVRAVLGAGSDDDLRVWRQWPWFWIGARDQTLPYVGMELFRAPDTRPETPASEPVDLEPWSEVFYQEENAVGVTTGMLFDALDATWP